MVVNLIALGALLYVAGPRSTAVGAQSSLMVMQEAAPREGQQAPDFSLGVRWDAPNETAYPFTFVVDTRHDHLRAYEPLSRRSSASWPRF